jgi:hypothetical protein
MIRLSDHFRVRRRYMRSVNLERDGELASSLAGYVLTTRALEVIERVVEAAGHRSTSRAWTVTGVYGTGKSAVANFIAALFASKGSPVRDQALKILRADASTSSLARKLQRTIPHDGFVRAVVVARREPLSHTVVRALARGAEEFWSVRPGPKPGAVHRVLALRASLRERAQIDMTDIAEIAKDIAAASGTGVLLIIDELGKLLEHAAHSGSGGDLFLLQQLAELPAAPGEAPVLVLGLLHQAFSEYGNLLAAAERAEWEKIQGRFEDIPFAESAEQMLRLIGDAIEAAPPPTVARAIKRRSADWSVRFTRTLSHPYVGEIMLSERIATVYPLHPLTALILPSLCTRFGQNDRSLFTFLAGTTAHALTGFLERTTASTDNLPLLRLPDVYDYFLDAAALGALSRAHMHRWAEIHGVITEAVGIESDEMEVLKVIGVLNLVASAGPLRAGRALVVASLLSTPDDPAEESRWTRALDGLVQRRVLTYRQQVDEYRVWQGSDFDIDAAVEIRTGTDRRSLATVLSSLAPLSPVVAQRHSYVTGTLRYFERQYVDDPERFAGATTSTEGSDGIVLYWLADHDPPAVPAITLDNKPLVVIETRVSRALQSAARELDALLNIEREEVALQTDSVARREVRQRIWLGRELLDLALRDAFEDRSARHQWFGGEERPDLNLNSMLSELCSRVYHRGPVLWNELINRRELTSQGARAQRELIAALLTAHDKPRLGINGSGPDFSMYASLLRSTGIHREQEGEWIIGPPTALGIKPLWDAVEQFCLSSTARMQPISELYRMLESPPYGVKRGVIPVMLAAVLQYHADNVSVYQDGSFLPVLGPAHFELLVKQPSRFAVKHIELTGIRWELFRVLEAMLRAEGASRRTAVRNATLLTVVRPLVRFAVGLPVVTREADDLTAEAKAVRDALLGTREPDRLIFEALPLAVGMPAFRSDEPASHERHEAFRKALVATLRELQLHYERLLDQCGAVIHDAFGVRTAVDHLREDLRVRASYLAGNVIEPRLRSFIAVALDESADDRDWLQSLVMIIADRPAETWTKDDLLAFEMNVTEMARRFINLEALQKQAAREGLEGFDARRITVTEPTGEEVHRLVWVDRQEKAVIEAHAQHVVQEIRRRVTQEHQQHAILMALLQLMLQPPQQQPEIPKQPEEERRHA